MRQLNAADIAECPTNVRFTPESGHPSTSSRCPFWAKSGHRDCFRRQGIEIPYGLAPALGQDTIIPRMMIVERTQYFAKPGLAAEVLNLRRKACAVRLSIGLPAGEIFVKHPGGDGSEPDVAWQCTFPDAAAREADLAARAASSAFESVRVEMRKLYARFERQVFSIADL